MCACVSVREKKRESVCVSLFRLAQPAIQVVSVGGCGWVSVCVGVRVCVCVRERECVCDYFV